MAWVAPAIGAVASIAGDLMSQGGQQATNAAMMKQQLQMEDWQAQMSDTAMQRRVTDLKAAGLNPLLAVGEGGASTPGISPVQLQNPSGSFAGLGGQVSSAMQTGISQQQVSQQAPVAAAQTAAQNASAYQSQMAGELAHIQALKAAGVDSDAVRQGIAESQARIDGIQAAAERDRAQAALNAQQQQVAKQQLPLMQEQIRNYASATNEQDARAALVRLQSAGQGLSNDQLALINPELLRTAQANASAARANATLQNLSVSKARAESDLYTAAPTMSVIEHMFGLFHIGASIGH